MNGPDLRARVPSWLGHAQAAAGHEFGRVRTSAAPSLDRTLANASRGLGEAVAQVGAVLDRSSAQVQELSGADPRVRIAGAFATGLVLGRVVNRLGH